MYNEMFTLIPEKSKGCQRSAAPHGDPTEQEVVPWGIADLLTDGGQQGKDVAESI